MKSVLESLIGVLVVLCFSMLGFAHVSGASTNENRVQSSAASERQMTTGQTDHQKMTYTGKVEFIDSPYRIMMVKGKEGDRAFDTTKINTPVKPGEQVSVTYHVGRSGEMVVSSLNTGTHSA